jgi:hypothetical protein
VERKYAAKSMMKMQTRAWDAITLGKALVQPAAVCSAGLPFCQATYNLEGDGFLAPIACALHSARTTCQHYCTLHRPRAPWMDWKQQPQEQQR